MRDNVINTAERLYRKFIKTWNRLTTLQKVLVVLGLVAVNVLGLLFLIFNEKIFGWLQPYAQKWKNTTGGWTILWAITFLTAFPPMIGYSTCGTTAGFVYGVWEGWLILATATVVGSFVSFIASRTVLRSYVERLMENDKRFAALTLTLKQDGLKLLCMVRLCPLPYSLSNGAMSTFQTVQPTMYALATAIITPKLFIHVFIGSRLAAIARSGETMSAGTKAVNYTSMAVFGLIGAAVGAYIYRRTMARARELEAEEEAAVRDSVRRTGRPPKQFMDDPEAQAAAETVAQDDAVDYFDEPASESNQYRDEPIDDEDPFGRGDGTVDEGVGLRSPKK
jgi:uncharacterized membrane protein YdjX (TVP38/TMEM64 family)